jgi:hypothetical protein
LAFMVAFISAIAASMTRLRVGGSWEGEGVEGETI